MTTHSTRNLEYKEACKPLKPNLNTRYRTSQLAPARFQDRHTLLPQDKKIFLLLPVQLPLVFHSAQLICDFCYFFGISALYFLPTSECMLIQKTNQ